MQRGLKLQNCKIAKLQNRQRGYMMITLMLALAMITIALLTVLPEIQQQIRRDREEELRHRGTEYMRAIQHFYKKFQRYPSRIEELENTNNLRFLRKRYTDPMNRDRVTGKERDFKFLHQTDISLNNGPVLAQIPGGAQPGGLQPTGGAGGQTSASGDSGNSSSGNPSDAGGNPNPAESSPSNSIAKSGFSAGLNGPVFGGGPILGVASASKEKTIRVFYNKDHYKDWLFIYLPMADRGGLLTGPVNPGMPTGNLNGPINPAPGGNLPGPGLTPNGSQPQSPPAQPPQPPGQTPPEQ
jgi:type II secretory pathway pseudopilin PulG